MHAMLARGREHYLGQKGPPLMRSLSNFSYENFNILEWMHNLARAHDNFLELLIGRGDGVFDQRARASCRHLNIFPDLWPEKMQYLSQIRTKRLSELSDDDISRQQHGWCRKWLRMCGIIRPQTERVRELRRRVIALRDAAVRGERIPIQGTNNPLPWRLTAAGKFTVNKRVAEIIYPHYTPVVNLGKDSFINKTGCWRTASKLIAFLCFLVPCLLGFVQEFRNGLRSLVWGLRILAGQTYSVDESIKLKIQVSQCALKKSDIRKATKLIIEGLSMIEGCCPVCLIVPAVHCLCHYGDGADLHGILTLLWMICFGKCVRVSLFTLSLNFYISCNALN